MLTPGSICYRCRYFLPVLVLVTNFTKPAVAGSIVEVQTSLGNFFLELNEEQAPLTSANFLNYVSTGSYNNTFIHEAIGGTFIRGGAYHYGSCGSEAVPIPTDAPIAFEETGLSNLTGTIAMRRQAEDLNSATSEWYINLSNDPDSDTRNGGYVVFGNIIGDGLPVVTEIANSRGYRLSFLNATPTINYKEEIIDCTQFSRDNVVHVLMSVLVDDTGEAASNYDSGSALLNMNVDLGSLGFTNLSFSIMSSGPRIIIQAQLDSAAALTTPLPGMATYNRITGKLFLPALSVDGVSEYRNVEFTLIDSENALFELTSYE